jgi:hypothetical protein
MQERYHEYIKRKLKEERERNELDRHRQDIMGKDFKVERERTKQKEDTI